MNLSSRRSVPYWLLFLLWLCAPLKLPAQGVSSSGGSLVESFFEAIQQNDTNTVFRLLDATTNLVHASYFGRLPLHVAAQKGSVAIVTRLLRGGADINEESDSLDTSSCHLTALDIAVWYGQPGVCRLLLDAGANPNAGHFHDGRALHLAFLHKRDEMVGWLLDHGANPFQEDSFVYSQATPIDRAIGCGGGQWVPRMLSLMPRFNTPSAQTNPVPPTLRLSRLPSNKTAAQVCAERGPRWLAVSAQHGELEAVKALLDAGVPANSNTSSNLSVLQVFALAEAAAEKTAGFNQQRWLNIRELLIQHGADYDAFAATALGDLNRARQLVDANGEIAEARDSIGQTPLHWAVQAGRSVLGSFWIQSETPLGATNFAGQTALHLAATAGKADFVRLLLTAKAPTEVRDTNGWTALESAIQARQPDCIHLLLSDKELLSRPERGLAARLHTVAGLGDVAAVATVMETETNLEARNELGLTPLQVAVNSGHLAVAAFLVDKKADINARDPEGNTLLLQTIPRFFNFSVHDRPPTNWLDRVARNATQRETYRTNLTVSPYEQGPHAIIQTVSFLLAAGIDVSATNHAGRTALDLVTDDNTILFDERQPLLKLLRDAGASIEQRDAQGNTALHRAVHAADSNQLDALAAILNSGADVNATNSAGKTPLHLAAEKIGGWDEDSEEPHEPFQALIKAKANVNAQDHGGLTPLHVLVAADTSFKREATRALLEAGANPNLKDKHGRTTAHRLLSVEWPWQDANTCLKILVQAGTDLNAKDDEGKTPLHYLASLGNKHPLFFLRGIDELFLGAKADLQARDNEGNTPLHLAAKTGTADVFEWLVKNGASRDATNNLGEIPNLKQPFPFQR